MRHGGLPHSYLEGRMVKGNWKNIAAELFAADDPKKTRILAAELHNALSQEEKQQPRADSGFLLDTNVVSELRKPKPQGAVLAWVNSVPAHQLLLSAVTVGELQAGVERTRRQDPKKANEIEKWIDQVARSYAVVPMDALCFREWARMMQRKPDQVLEDMMIAATARVHHLVLATRNQRDFAGIDIEILNPFAA